MKTWKNKKLNIKVSFFLMSDMSEQYAPALSIFENHLMYPSVRIPRCIISILLCKSVLKLFLSQGGKKKILTRKIVKKVKNSDENMKKN